MSARFVEPISRDVRAIEDILKEQRVPRRDVVLDAAWVKAAQAPEIAAPGPTLSRTPVLEAPARGVTLVMLAAPPDEEALSALAAASERLYVLAPAGWAPKLPALLQRSGVFIRRAKEVPVSAVHSAAGACLWMGAAPSGPAPWRLQLDAAQGEALRALFLRVFWHEAVDEAWTSEGHARFTPAQERPFDVPTLGAKAPLRRAPLDEASSLRGTHVFQSTPSAPPPEVCCLWTPPSGAGHEALRRQVEAGAKVAWDALALPDLSTDGETGVARLPGESSALRLTLNPQQSAALKQLLEQPARWTFSPHVRLGEVEGRGAELWLAGAPRPRGLVPEQRLQLPDLRASSLREARGLSPRALPDPDPLALEAVYPWRVLPPRLPSNTKEDPLVGRWRALDAEARARVATLEASLREAEDERERIGGAFSRLIGAMRGFKRTQQELSQEREALSHRLPSKEGPQGAAGLLRELAALESRCEALRSQLKESDRKAREDAEREAQERAWQAKVEAARVALPARRQEHSEATKQRARCLSQLAALEAALAGAEKEAKQDLKANKRKLSDELKRADRDIKQLEDTIEALQLQLSEPFTFTPSASSAPPRPRPGGRFVPTAAPTPSAATPEEALPEVGALRRGAKVRYLVIQRWDELEVGERDAERLGAQLVAPEAP